MFDQNFRTQVMYLAVASFSAVVILVISDLGFYTNALVNLIAIFTIILTVGYFVYMAMSLNPQWVDTHG